MYRRCTLIALLASVCVGLVTFCQAPAAQADEWGRYYHWPYSDMRQYQWSPYEYEKVYDGGYRYPKEMRTYPSRIGWRNWSTARKPYYRGYHFILDQF